MELFPDGHHVRLRSRVHGTYLHADEDRRSVSLSPLRASLNGAWQVHQAQRNNAPYVLFHSAAYGRYLARSPQRAPPGHKGRRAVQAVYDAEEQDDDVFWLPIRVAGGDEYVLLQHFSNHLLRANGRHRTWNTGVSVDDYFSRSSMMEWAVEAIPPRPEPPEIPGPTPAAPPRGGFRDLFLCRAMPVVEQRTIRYVRAEDDGSFDPNGWREIQFEGRSVYNLRSAVAQDLADPIYLGIKLCVRAGSLGRLVPLVIDLPRNEEPIDFVALSTWTPSAACTVEDWSRASEDIITIHLLRNRTYRCSGYIDMRIGCLLSFQKLGNSSVSAS